MKFAVWFVVVMMACCSSLLQIATAQQTPDQPLAPGQPEQTAEDQTAEAGWPREFDTDGKHFTIYQPQVEKWSNNRIEQRSAVAVQTSNASEPVFGVIWMSGRTEVNKATRLVTLNDVQIIKASFPTAQSQQKELLATLRQEIPNTLNPVSLDRLEASLAVNKTEHARTATLKNEPPKVIYSNSPAVLVYIDGQPVLRDSAAGENLLRVINTHALVLFDQSEATYYFYLGDRWFSAGSLNGPWEQGTNLPQTVSTALDKAKQSAVDQGQVDLLNNDETLAALKAGTPPKIYVSTVPTELVVTKGSPQYQPVPNTDLLYVKNTASNLFLNTKDQNYYLLLSGRWYRANKLGANWAYVSQHALPRDFAKIPETHPKSEVLASVADTPQAKEAAISNDIPQTATIDRQQAGAEVTYDGAPKFVPLEGSSLEYASNSATPVIRVNSSSYYCVQNGVWFIGPTPTGPWAVATSVPTEIYSIPPSAPIYYVTYVYVYGFGPRFVYVGYLPGYLGSYVTPDGVVVFGTGWPYHHWIGSVWYGPPVTFGFGVTWGWGFGWNLRLGFGPFWGGTCFHPWWGPWRYGWYGHGFRYPRFTNVTINVNQTNVYHHWGRNVVAHGWSGPRIGGGPRSVSGSSSGSGSVSGGPRMGPGVGGHRAFSGNPRPNNLYSDHNGNLYRYDRGRGWQSYSNRGWQPMHPNRSQVAQPGRPPQQPNSRFSGVNKQPSQFSRGQRGPSQELNQERMARDRGEQRARNFQPQYRNSGGGGFGGGKGFGGGNHTRSGRGGSHRGR